MKYTQLLSYFVTVQRQKATENVINIQVSNSVTKWYTVSHEKGLWNSWSRTFPELRMRVEDYIFRCHFPHCGIFFNQKYAIIIDSLINFFVFIFDFGFFFPMLFPHDCPKLISKYKILQKNLDNYYDLRQFLAIINPSLDLLIFAWKFQKNLFLGLSHHPITSRP